MTQAHALPDMLKSSDALLCTHERVCKAVRVQCCRLKHSGQPLHPALVLQAAPAWQQCRACSPCCCAH